MKFIVVVALVCVAAAAARPGSTYTDKYDNANLDEILTSNRLLRGYISCLVGKGRCTADGNELKKVMPEALENECQKCTKKQKEGAEKVIKYIVNNRPELWKEMAEVYDPDNIYQERYKDKIAAAKSAA